MKTLPLFILGIIAITLSSCANYKVYKASDTTRKDGLRFNRPDLYLFVTETDSGKFETKVVPLPGEEYVIVKKGFIGKADLTATLTDGWLLSSYGATFDSQIAELLTSAAGIATAFKKTDSKSLAEAPKETVAHTSIYKIESKDGQLTLTQVFVKK
jgi:hypothetical protein